MIRYEYGGEEFVFVELAEEMSLEANFHAMSVSQKLKEKNWPGILEVCPGNSSYMVRVDPDILRPDQLVEELKKMDEQGTDIFNTSIQSRIVDIPVLFEDPWTHEALMRFRDRHQDPTSTDLEYAARINGYDTKEAFIDAMTSSPFLVSMVGFVPGLPWCYQIVPREKQIEVPKYLRPRTFTPERTFGFGGAFACIYPVQGAGGYQLFGIAAAPIFDKDQRLSDFKDSMVFPRQGDVFSFRSVGLEEYNDIGKQVKEGTFKYAIKDIVLHPDEVIKNPEQFSESVLGRLYHDQRQ